MTDESHDSVKSFIEAMADAVQERFANSDPDHESDEFVTAMFHTNPKTLLACLDDDLAAQLHVGVDHVNTPAVFTTDPNIARQLRESKYVARTFDADSDEYEALVGDVGDMSDDAVDIDID
jgi:hypothetical protein